MTEARKAKWLPIRSVAGRVFVLGKALRFHTGFPPIITSLILAWHSHLSRKLSQEERFAKLIEEASMDAYLGRRVGRVTRARQTASQP